MALKNIYKYPRYWYHISSTLKGKVEHLIPWDEDKGFNRTDREPKGKRICVAPTIEQCIVAVPYLPSSKFAIYRTIRKIKAEQAVDVFDVNITNEGWITFPMTFVKVGTINFSEIEDKLNIKSIISEPSSTANPQFAGRVLKWWKKLRINRFIEKV